MLAPERRGSSAAAAAAPPPHSLLPPDVVTHALSFLGARDLSAATCVNRLWRSCVYFPSARESLLWAAALRRRARELGSATPPARVALGRGMDVLGFRELYHHAVVWPSQLDVGLMELRPARPHTMLPLPGRPGDGGACLRVRYTGSMRGGDRCVRSARPFPALGAGDGPTPPFAAMVAEGGGGGGGGHDDRDRDDGGPSAARLSLVAYYEVRVGRRGQGLPGGGLEEREPRGDTCVTVGLAEREFPLAGYQPGWSPLSYGYHGDDGCRYHGSGDGSAYGPPFGEGDVVGCGVDYDTQSVFFTLNGRFLGNAFGGARGVLYPVVGVDSYLPLEVNFGARPFSFDVALWERRRNLHACQNLAARMGRGAYARPGFEPPARDTDPSAARDPHHGGYGVGLPEVSHLFRRFAAAARAAAQAPATSATSLAERLAEGLAELQQELHEFREAVYATEAVAAEHGRRAGCAPAPEVAEGASPAVALAPAPDLGGGGGAAATTAAAAAATAAESDPGYDSSSSSSSRRFSSRSSSSSSDEEDDEDQMTGRELFARRLRLALQPGPARRDASTQTGAADGDGGGGGLDGLDVARPLAAEGHCVPAPAARSRRGSHQHGGGTGSSDFQHAGTSMTPALGPAAAPPPPPPASLSAR